jgi:hypothetical protein
VPQGRGTLPMETLNERRWQAVQLGRRDPLVIAER